MSTRNKYTLTCEMNLYGKFILLICNRLYIYMHIYIHIPLCKQRLYTSTLYVCLRRVSACTVTGQEKRRSKTVLVTMVELQTVPIPLQVEAIVKLAGRSVNNLQPNSRVIRNKGQVTNNTRQTRHVD